MNDNQLFALVLATINAGLAARGQGAIKVKRKYQRKQRGPNSADSVYLFKVGDRRIGSPKRDDVWNGTDFTHTETQVYETTFQVSAQVLENPADVNQLTASDLVSIVADIMQGDMGQAALRVSRVSVLRVSEIRNPYVVDDHSQFEAEPSFDFVLTYDRSNVSNVPVVTTVDTRTNIHGV